MRRACLVAIVVLGGLAVAGSSRAAESERSRVAGIEVYAQRYGIPIGLARALVGQESGGNASAVSPKGATGLTQVMPETAAGMYGITPEKARVLLMNPDFALDAGMKYLSMQKEAFGSWRLALAAYNAGPNAVRKYDGIPPYAETQAYVRNIMAKAGGGSAEPLSWPAEPSGEPAAPFVQPSAMPDMLAPRQPSPFGKSIEDGMFALAQGTYDPTESVKTLLGIKPRPQIAARPKSGF